MKRYFQTAAGVLMFVMGCGLAFSSCSYSILRDGSQWPATITAFVGIFSGIAGICLWPGFLRSRSDSKRFGIFLDGLALFGIYGTGSLALSTNSFFALGPTGKPTFHIQPALISAFICVSAFSLLLRFFLNKNLPMVRGKMHQAVLLVVPVVAMLLFGCLNWASAEDPIVLKDGREILLRSRGVPFLTMQAVQTREISETGLEDRHSQTVFKFPDGEILEIENNNAFVTLPGFPARQIAGESNQTFLCPDLTSVSLGQNKFIIQFFRQSPIYIGKDTGDAVFANGRTQVWKTGGVIADIAIGCLFGLGFLMCAAVRIHRKVSEYHGENRQ